MTKISAAAKPIKVHSGQPIIEEGKTGQEMYILVEGECLVEKGGIELGILNIPGSYFGELPIVNSRDRHSETRQRTVKAVTDCDVIYIDQEDIQAIAERHPELQSKLKQFASLGQGKGGKKGENSMADAWAQEHSYGAKGGAGQDKVTRLLNTITSKKFNMPGSNGSGSPAGGGGLLGELSSQSSPAQHENRFGNLTREASNGGRGGNSPRVSPRGASREELVDLFGQLEAKMMARLDAVLGAQGAGGTEEGLLPRGERRP